MRRRWRTEGGRGGRRREVVPGVSSLTTCDELREARSEIKRVPENSRGSARSNYLHEARRPTVESTFFPVFSLPLPHSRAAFARSVSFSPSPFVVRYAENVTGRRGSEAQGIILDYFLCSTLTKRDNGDKRGRSRDI